MKSVGLYSSGLSKIVYLDMVVFCECWFDCSTLNLFPHMMKHSYISYRVYWAFLPAMTSIDCPDLNTFLAVKSILGLIYEVVIKVEGLSRFVIKQSKYTSILVCLNLTIEVWDYYFNLGFSLVISKKNWVSLEAI